MTGHPVLLQVPSGLDYLVAFLGCQLAGTIAVPSYPYKSRRTWPRLMSIVRDSGASLVLAKTPD